MLALAISKNPHCYGSLTLVTFWVLLENFRDGIKPQLKSLRVYPDDERQKPNFLVEHDVKS